MIGSIGDDGGEMTTAVGVALCVCVVVLVMIFGKGRPVATGVALVMVIYLAKVIYRGDAERIVDTIVVSVVMWCGVVIATWMYERGRRSRGPEERPKKNGG